MRPNSQTVFVRKENVLVALGKMSEELVKALDVEGRLIAVPERHSQTGRQRQLLFERCFPNPFCPRALNVAFICPAASRNIPMRR